MFIENKLIFANQKNRYNKILPIKVRRRTMSKLLREIKLATIPFEPKSTSEIKNFK